LLALPELAMGAGLILALGWQMQTLLARQAWWQPGLALVWSEWSDRVRVWLVQAEQTSVARAMLKQGWVLPFGLQVLALLWAAQVFAIWPRQAQLDLSQALSLLRPGQPMMLV